MKFDQCADGVDGYHDQGSAAAGVPRFSRVRHCAAQAGPAAVSMTAAGQGHGDTECAAHRDNPSISVVRSATGLPLRPNPACCRRLGRHGPHNAVRHLRGVGGQRLGGLVMMATGTGGGGPAGSNNLGSRAGIEPATSSNSFVGTRDSNGQRRPRQNRG
jgi:hypothetical protein